jgi:hypothetical protein
MAQEGFLFHIFGVRPGLLTTPFLGNPSMASFISSNETLGLVSSSSKLGYLIIITERCHAQQDAAAPVVPVRA